MYNPQSGRTEYYEHIPLAFGARTSVLSFNLLARALRHVLVVGVGVPIEHYFDDYPCIVPKQFADFAESAVSRVMALLGWDLKAPKNPEDLAVQERPLGPHGFAGAFTCLGVVIQLWK